MEDLLSFLVFLFQKMILEVV